MMLTKRSAAVLVVLATCATVARAQQGSPVAPQGDIQPPTHYHASEYAAGYSSAPLQSASSVYAGSYGCRGASCPGCPTCAGEVGFFGRWMEKLRRFRQDKYYYENGKTYGFRHPVCPPFDHANWGYHQTCWRRFPPLCYECPPSSQSAASPDHSVPPAPEGHQPQPEPAPYDPTGYRNGSFGTEPIAPAEFDGDRIESPTSIPESETSSRVAPSGFDYVDELAPDAGTWRPATSGRSEIPSTGFEYVGPTAPEPQGWRPSTRGRSEVASPSVADNDDSFREIGTWVPSQNGKTQVDDSTYVPIDRAEGTPGGKAQVRVEGEFDFEFEGGHSLPSGRAQVAPSGFEAVEPDDGSEAQSADSGRVELNDLAE